MARKSRTIIPGIPHHVVHRGARKGILFQDEHDYQVYLSIMSTYIQKHEIEVWCYCLMPNHVHLMMLPKDGISLSKCIRDSHRQYSKYFNKKYDLKGHAWEARYGSFPIDEIYILPTAKYIERNCVAANIVDSPEVFRWSSCKTNVFNYSDPLLKTRELVKLTKNWLEFVSEPSSKEIIKMITYHQKTGEPLLRISVPGTIPGTNVGTKRILGR